MEVPIFVIFAIGLPLCWLMGHFGIIMVREYRKGKEGKDEKADT